ncbi:putative olfactory receptor 2W6 [Erinaceus europaeus]|uniref:Olfactory receptor n=1 Tax=Erinaceus europaeus TaxID=9365 RepID=A0A1S3A016_ERIEU|nr:putative olfactory receptor 2W6 [Erinaceus europaeus]
MMKINDSSRDHFILVGFSEYPRAEFILSLFASGFYAMTLLGNAVIILVSVLDSRLHTPMYFFLRNLSFLDMCFTTSIVPQMLANMWEKSKTITYVGCVVQFSVALALGSTECVLLAVMAVDRYVAVCWPLRYTTIMHQQVCHIFAATSWLSGFANSLFQSSLAMLLPLCGHHRVDHFLCEILIIVKLSCVDTHPTESKMLVARMIILIIPVSIILTSYALIARAVVRMKSAEGRKKAFGTCASHLVVVSLFYGTVMFMYLQPKHKYSQHQGKALALVYTTVAPSMNPLVYTLRNKDVKRAIRKVVWKDSL